MFQSTMWNRKACVVNSRFDNIFKRISDMHGTSALFANEGMFVRYFITGWTLKFELLELNLSMWSCICQCHT